MNKKRLLLACALLAFFSVDAFASDIYKRVNEDGVSEFSDKPFPGAEAVTVWPNIVETAPAPERKARVAPARGVAEAAAPAKQSSAPESDGDVNYVRARTRDEARAREERREDRTRRDYRPKPGEEPATDPNPGRATRNAIRNAPAPGPR